MIGSDEFSRREPDLARFGEERLSRAPAYLATIRATGAPRVHPVTPIIAPTGLYVFMEPASPKGGDLRERRRYALHSAVPDNEGTGGEFSLSGEGHPVDDASTRSIVAGAARYAPADDYVLFELRVGEARANGYGDVVLPATRRWSVDG